MGLLVLVSLLRRVVAVCVFPVVTAVGLAQTSVLLGTPVAGQAHAVLVEPPIPLLPARFGSWQAREAVATGTDATQADAASAAILKEDGLTRFSTATYASQGAETLAVKAMQFGDATGAYSAYTFLRRPEMRPTPSRLGTESVTGGDEVLLVAGTTVLMATGAAVRGGTLHDLTNLAAALPKVSGSRGQAPLLPTLLPRAGLVPRSVRYALGPEGYGAMAPALPASLVAFNKSTEVATAEYEGRGGKGELTLLLCPTPQIAGDQGRTIETALRSALPPGSAPGTVKLRRIGPMIAMSSGAFTPAQGQALVTAVQLPMDLTWNKQMPLEFHTEVRKTASLLVNIAVLSGVLMLAAVTLGLFFGGGRAAIRVMQGKPAYMEPEFLRIDLRGSSTRSGGIQRESSE